MNASATFPRVGEIHFHDTHVAIWEDIPNALDREVIFGGVQAAFEKLLDHLRRRGFTLKPDPKVDKLIRQHHWVGRKGSLELHADTGGRTAEVEFFQNVANVDNQYGGRYDFGKFGRMPRDLRLRCAVEMTQLIRAMQALGYTFGPLSDLSEPLPRAVLRKAENRVEEGLSPLERYNRGRESRERLNAWQTPEDLDRKAQSYDRKDRDGRLLCNGDVRYFYDYDGRLSRGQVFYEGGNCWSVFSADGTWLSKPGNYKLFSTDRPDLLPRREVKEPQVSRVSRELQKARAARDTVLKQFGSKGGQTMAAPLAARVAVLEKVLARITAGERGYYVLSLKHSKMDDECLTFWGPNASGYVWWLAGAGRYQEPEIKAHQSYYDDEAHTIAVPCEAVEKLANAKGMVPYTTANLRALRAAAGRARGARGQTSLKADRKAKQKASAAAGRAA